MNLIPLHRLQLSALLAPVNGKAAANAQTLIFCRLRFLCRILLHLQERDEYRSNDGTAGKANCSGSNESCILHNGKGYIQQQI